jgi:hypothetical protein
MIPDNSLYGSVYQEYYLDEHHLLFAVLYNKERPYSVLDFKTKIPVSKGLEAPTHGQMGELVRSIIKEPAEAASKPYDDQTSFEEGQEVIVTRTFRKFSTPTRVPLREGIDVQAKAFDESKPLPEYCAEKSKESISAYTKNTHGGTIYLGIREEKINDRDTGRLLAQGSTLEGPRKERVEATINSIEKEVRETLRWIGKKSPMQDQIRVKERKAGQRDGKDVFIVEIKVEYYHGLCFYDPEGPLLFKANFERGGKPDVKKLGLYDWLRKYEGAKENLTYDSHFSNSPSSSRSSNSGQLKVSQQSAGERKRRYDGSGSTHSSTKRGRN